jgi:ABC-type glycerol-3-phosphate transport system substrate-binding protein
MLGDKPNNKISRRTFLRGAAAATGFAVTSGMLASCVQPPVGPTGASEVVQPTQAPATIVKPSKITFSWWGEPEAPGMRGWVEESVQLFQQQNPNITVETMEQATDAVVPSFKGWMTAQSGPDAFFHWSNPSFLEGIWAGGMEPLDDLMKDDLVHVPERVRNWAKWDGQARSIPFYTVSFWNCYNKDMFAGAGADPDKPPETLAEWIELGKKINEKGDIAYEVGVKEQWGCDWFSQPWADLGCESTRDWMEHWLGLNGKSMESPAVAEWWVHAKEIFDAKLLNDDTLSTGLYEGLDKFGSGGAANVTGIQPMIKSWSRKMGDTLGHYFGGPTWSTPRDFTRDVPFGTQWLAIGPWSQAKDDAAKWLSFLRTPDRLKALYLKSNAVMLDDRFDPSWFETQWERDLFNLMLNGKRWVISYVSPAPWEDWAVKNFMGLYQGTMTPQEAAAYAEKVMSDFRKDQPELYENYIKWMENF